jgi:hypothetical protein
MKEHSIEPATDHVGTAAPGCPIERSSTRVAGGGTGSPVRAMKLAERLKSCGEIFLAALREIFDESAYARFLNQKQLASSRAAYASFRQEYEITKARRPRCC